jgi:acyl-[acyl-carrier-protein]-phospholipid O-acyltransferase/long-chain-fatty-acid--[acyl-carrier-protein] ligase
VALPDARRGERLVLVTEAPEVKREALIEAAHQERLPEIAIPREVRQVAALPLLGSGKTDYPAVQQIAASADTGSPGEPAGSEPAGIAAAG